MIIRTVSFKNLHGHLNPKLSFQPGVNILIGVNGSGKTSVLNAMAWTLSPASIQDGLPAGYLLSSLKFDEINIAYTVPGQRKHQRVKAKRHENSIIIEVTGIKDVLEIPIVGRHHPSRMSAIREIDESANLSARFMDDQRDNPVLRYLSELPGPLYLPLNRRWTEEGEAPSRARARRSTTAGHLPISEVLDLAEHVFRQEQAETFALNETLRNSILTSLFEVDGFASPSSVWTLDELTERSNRVVKALENLGLNEARILSEKYFARLRNVVTELGGQTIPENFSHDPKSEKWVEWIFEGSPIVFRIERLIPLIERYESDRMKITQRSSAFLDSVNSFIRDNGKEIEFLRRFDLSVRLPNGQQISSHTLSSGELQLLTLFTFLYFQFDPKQEFAVLVDEPELSLHVSWQNRYVNSVKAANPNAQFIIATHSPEIAGPAAEDTIIDISPKHGTYAQL